MLTPEMLEFASKFGFPALVATPAFAQYGQQNVQQNSYGQQNVQQAHGQQSQKQQKVIVREKVIVQNADPYAAYAAAVHAQNQADIQKLLNAAAKQALKDQAKSQSRRQRSRIVNRRGSSLNVQVNRNGRRGGGGFLGGGFF